MSERKIILSRTAPEPIGPYAQAVQAGDLIFCSGQIGLDPQTGTIPTTVEAESRQVMNNLGEVLKSAGVSFDQVVKCSIFLKSMSDFGTVNKVYGEYFAEGNYPARETVEVSGLPRNVKVEISLIALKPQGK
ncbi:MAG: Rid family detoxifying hydrolase [Bacteroidetes bacterium]|jgi:2-iminobutanoate/2-iminopropanoate deaminase|nr:Rid family detoxifying hydrolase [Bacteroidota bacterium]